MVTPKRKTVHNMQIEITTILNIQSNIEFEHESNTLVQQKTIESITLYETLYQSTSCPI